MERIKNYTIIVLFCVIGVLLLLRQCKPSINRDDALNQRKDTSWVDTIIIDHNLIVFKPEYYPQWDTFIKTDTLKWSNEICNFTRFYNDSVSDSNITIYNNLEVIGLIKESNTSYRLKVPKLIKETREIYDTKVLPNKFDMFVISEIGGNKTQFNLGIGAGIKYKKAYYGYKYGIIDKSHNISIGYNIFSSKK